VTLGGRTVTLYPLFHPAAALYTPTMLEVLERDFARLPELLGTRDEGSEPVVEMPTHQAPEDTELGAPGRQPVQLGLF